MQKLIMGNYIKTLKYFPFKNGITTKKMGNFSFKKNKNIKRKIFKLMNITNARMHYRIMAEHSDKIKVIKNIFVPVTLNGNSTINLTCDAIICRKNEGVNNVILTSTTADCPTVIIASKNDNIVAIVHSGWRGTKKDIVPKTIIKFMKLGVNTKDIKVGIYPGICEYCYKVGNEFYDFFPGYVTNNKTINLKNIITEQMFMMDILSENIYSMDICSAHSVENGEFQFYSHRRNKTLERNIVFVSF